MKDIFFAYPAGPPGLALLLLRGSVVSWLLTAPIAMASGGWIVVVTCFIALALSVGFSVRVAATCFAFCLALVALAGQSPMQALAVPTLDSLALALIGPGAYSIDALIFGRRTMRLPG